MLNLLFLFTLLSINNTVPHPTSPQTHHTTIPQHLVCPHHLLQYPTLSRTKPCIGPWHVKPTASASLPTMPLSTNISHGMKMNAPPWPWTTPLPHTIGPSITTTQLVPHLQPHLCSIRKAAMQALPCQPHYVGQPSNSAPSAMSMSARTLQFAILTHTLQCP